jgi:hypothetical protein
MCIDVYVPPMASLVNVGPEYAHRTGLVTLIQLLAKAHNKIAHCF